MPKQKLYTYVGTYVHIYIHIHTYVWIPFLFIHDANADALARKGGCMCERTFQAINCLNMCKTMLQNKFTPRKINKNTQENKKK